MTFICYKEAHRQLQVYAGEIWPANDKTSFVPLTYPPTSAQRLDFIHVLFIHLIRTSVGKQLWSKQCPQKGRWIVNFSPIF